MATWESLRQYIYSRYQVMEEQPGVLRMMFDVGGGRTQNVLVSGKNVGAFEYMVIWTPICHESQISARDALVRNANMPIGSLGLAPDGTIILRHSAPLKDLEPDEFDVPLQAITQGGDMLERELAVADRF
jgi:hypothetical protein